MYLIRCFGLWRLWTKREQLSILQQKKAHPASSATAAEKLRNASAVDTRMMRATRPLLAPNFSASSDTLLALGNAASSTITVSANGVSGTPNAMAAVHYRYAGAKMQAGGRGFLGFRQIVSFDPNQSAGHHVASATEQTRQAMADLVLENLRVFFAEGKLVTPVP